MKVRLPYGKGFLETEAEEERVLAARPLPAAEDAAAAVERALADPVGSAPLSELAKGKRTGVIIISDHTRPVPSRAILPAMLREMRRGSPDMDITLLVATGCHRQTTLAELKEKLGEDLFRSVRINVHDAFDPKCSIGIGRLPSGAELLLDKTAAEADLLAAEGFIEPHFFAGFSGGRKSVLPGICGKSTVYENHCGEFIAHERARCGVLEGNPIHRDMEAAAEMAGLRFIVNAVLNGEKKTAAMFAGDFRKAHAAGVEYLKRSCTVKAVPGDTVLVTNGGSPLDQNLYQCVKGLAAAEATAAPGAVLILCAEMADGIGGEGFYRDLKECESPAQLYRRFMETPRQDTVPDQWQTQILCRILMKHRVIFVTRPEMEKPIRDMKMEYAPDVDTALAMAGGGRLTVIPDGVGVCVLPQEP